MPHRPLPPRQRIGRPRRALGISRLDGKEKDIRALLGKDVSKASIAMILDVSRSAAFSLRLTRLISCFGVAVVRRCVQAFG